MDMNMVLHGYFRSTASWRVRIALALKGVAYDQVSHHLRCGGQRAPGYLTINPQGFVLAIKKEADAVPGRQPDAECQSDAE